MEITYLGHSSFLFVASDGTMTLTDPYHSYVGRDFPQVDTDVVIISHGHDDHSAAEQVSSYNYIIDKPGEYCYNNIRFRCFYCDHDGCGGALRGKTLITIFQIDGVTLCHMGDVGEVCNLDLAARIGAVDILFIPVGGKYTVDAAGAKTYTDALQPKITVPMHYKSEFCVFDIDGAEKFIKLFDKSAVETAPSTITVTKDLMKRAVKIIFMQIA